MATDTATSPLRRHTTLAAPQAPRRGGSTSPESGFASGGSMSPELVYGRGGSMSPDFAHGHAHGQGHSPMAEDELVIARPLSCSRPSTDSYSHECNVGAGTAHPAGGPMSAAEEAYFARAHSGAEMCTFHCEPVRKMPLSGLDPSMLTGFVVRDEAEWVDLKKRVREVGSVLPFHLRSRPLVLTDLYSQLPRTIFGIQDEPPTWPGADDDDDIGLESISDPEEADDASMTGTSQARPMHRPQAPRTPSPAPPRPSPTCTRTTGRIPRPTRRRGPHGGGPRCAYHAAPSVHYPFPVSAEDGTGAGAVTPQRERRGSRSAI
ncbi:hypothetical protein K438DRAFT_2006340 [Mycena galopus ATCC 62051]|nr:hypothetical protein K438DRAFT_2006340 [Mycena galopus ATCC 62051]